MAEIPVSALAVSIDEACRLTNLSKPTLYSEIEAGRLRSFTQGRRRLISVRALKDWIAARERQALTPKGARPQSTKRNHSKSKKSAKARQTVRLGGSL